MSSTQEKRGEQIARAEAHAREAAREITHDRTESARVLGEGHRAGILETMQQSAVGRTLGVARDTAAQNKLGDTAVEKATEAKDTTTEKARETKGASEQQTEELKESTHKGAEKATDSTAATAKSPEQKK